MSLPRVRYSSHIYHNASYDGDHSPEGSLSYDEQEGTSDETAVKGAEVKQGHVTRDDSVKLTKSDDDVESGHVTSDPPPRRSIPGLPPDLDVRVGSHGTITWRGRVANTGKHFKMHPQFSAFYKMEKEKMERE